MEGFQLPVKQGTLYLDRACGEDNALSEKREDDFNLRAYGGQEAGL